MWNHRWWREQAIGTGGKIEAKGTLRLVRASAGLGAPLEKAGGQGGVDQPDRGRLDRGAGRAGSGGFGYGVARRTFAAGLSSRRPL